MLVVNRAAVQQKVVVVVLVTIGITHIVNIWVVPPAVTIAVQFHSVSETMMVAIRSKFNLACHNKYRKMRYFYLFKVTL